MAASLSSHLSKICVPLGGQKVYKDECIFSFDTPDCESGLYICMKTFVGLGEKFVRKYFEKTGNAVFLHMKRIKKEIPQTEDDPPKKKPTKMAIGVEGGFDVQGKKYEFDEINSIVVLPDWAVLHLPDADLPMQASLSVTGILAADSAARQDELAALAGTWDGEKRVISKHAENLVQLADVHKIPPKGWRCSRCDMTDNLWLNLTDGTILCGRKFFDGSGGNNHAVDHYQETKYPLAVKLGTITPDGADVYSYDEDDMVEDPHLTKHLAHFGINVASLEKTDKTMAELEIDLNQKVGEWDVIQEAGSKLTPVYGPGYTGIRNLGNSCYMNAIMQVLFTMPEFEKRYADAAERIFDNAPEDPSADFSVQMAKFGRGLLSGQYSKPAQEAAGDSTESTVQYQEGVRPQMFKSLIGRGHQEFSTKRQQDAQEFLLHLINLIERNSRGTENPTDTFKFQVEERIQCIQSSMVKYTDRVDYILPLPIPQDGATNKEAVLAYEAKKRELEASGKFIDPKELVRPRIPFATCLNTFAAEEIVEDFYSTALLAKTMAQKTTKLLSFPDYMFIQLKKFTIGNDWVPKKLDVSVDMPDEIDISCLRAHGLQAGERQLPEANKAPPVQIDETVVQQLMDMGFAAEGCRKAVYHTQNQGVEAAMNWVMEHMEDADFAVPLQLPGSGGGGKFVPNEDALAMIMSMGFSRDQVTKALKATDNNTERAADWIFSHVDELDTPMETEQSGSGDQPRFRDGPGKYKLVAFVSHMGTSTMVGHYVCHILKEGRWVIFNDEKVALSEHPPKDLGYLYLYQRI